MATRGRKPKPDYLKLMDGTFQSCRSREGAPEATGELVKPAYLKGRASALWDEYAPLLHWLGQVDSPKLAMWCCLEAEWRRAPGKMTCSKIGQLRNVGSEIGIGPAERLRLGQGEKKPQTKASAYVR